MDMIRALNHGWLEKHCTSGQNFFIYFWTKKLDSIMLLACLQLVWVVHLSRVTGFHFPVGFHVKFHYFSSFYSLQPLLVSLAISLFLYNIPLLAKFWIWIWISLIPLDLNLKSYGIKHEYQCFLFAKTLLFFSCVSNICTAQFLSYVHDNMLHKNLQLC